MMSPFISPSLLAFPFACMVNKEHEKVTKRRGVVDESYGFYLLRNANLMAKRTCMCLIASSVIIITKRVAVVYQFKSARMVSC